MGSLEHYGDGAVSAFNSWHTALLIELWRIYYQLYKVDAGTIC